MVDNKTCKLEKHWLALEQTTELIIIESFKL